MRLCDRWHCPPSVILAEDGETLMRLLQVEALGRPEPPPGDPP